MGYIKEPEGVDFVIQSKPLTDKQEKDLSEFIAKRKLEINVCISRFLTTPAPRAYLSKP